MFCVLCILLALCVKSEEILNINAKSSDAGYLIPSPIGIPEIEYQTLYELYNATNGPNWNWHDLANNSVPWQFATPANPCRETEKWEGIICSTTGTVPNQEFSITHIDLVARNLSGSLPNTIDNLASLIRFALPQNHLNGTIPGSLGNIPFLSHLDLADNELDGTIPENLGLLYNLTHFGLDTNQLTGTIPDIFTNMTEINSVFLSHNNFVGTMPEFFAELPHLVYLYLSHNMLHGPLLESLGSLSKLAYLDLDSNYFTGTIPQTFEKLTRLHFLGLQKNQLTGTIPDIFHDMDKLQFLYLNNEKFRGPISSQLGNLRKLIFLHLQYNQLTGTIPESFGSLHKLEYLYLYNNMLTGTIPASISSLPELNSLQVQSNSLSGSLEGVFNSTAQRKLKVVQLSNNQFTGSLPSELFLLDRLVTLIAISSCFRGTFPATICNATKLETLILDALHSGSSCQNVLIPGISSAYGQSDTFYGQVPLCLFDVPTLNTLHLSGNSLSGTLPADLQIQDRLLDMDLCHNLLHGSIPENIQNRIWYNLDMSFNRFTGILIADFYAYQRNLSFEFRVEEFTLNFTELPGAIALDLDNNRLSGDLPRVLRGMKNITVLDGNLFGCKYDKSNLPQHDEGEKIYVCGSNAFDVPYYVWVVLVGTLSITACALWYWRSAVDKYVGISATAALLRQWLAVLSPSPNEPLDTAIRLRNVRYVASVLSMMEKLISLCLVFVLVILLPIYIVLSVYYGTHTYQYAYTISGTFTSGVAPFITFIIALGALMLFFSACCSYLVRYLDQRLLNIIVVEEGDDAASGSGNAAARKVASRLEHISVRAAYFLINVVVVVGVNIAFVVVALYQSTVLLIFAQILLSLFKVIWNLVCSPILIRWTSNYLTTTSADDNKKSGNVFFALQLFVSLFNNIAIPCLVVAVVDPNCFYNLVVPAPPEDTNYLYAVCAVYGYQGCRKVIPQIAISSYDPSFVYSYQCGSSFITYYAPTFVYVCFVAAFVSPLIQYAAMKVHQTVPRNRPLYRLLDSVLPPVWKPVIPLDSPVMVKRNIFKPFFDANLVLITMFTYAGVMLTFGAIFPPLGFALAVTAVAVSYLAKLKVGRLLTTVLAEDQWMYLDIIEAECQDVGTAVKLQEAVRMVIGFSCVFYTLFLFDALGDAVGFTGASWVLIVVPLTPPFLYAAFDTHVLATTAAKGPVAAAEEGGTTEMKRFSKPRGLRSDDGMTRSTVESRDTALSDLKRLASESSRDTNERGNSDVDSVSNVLHNSM